MLTCHELLSLQMLEDRNSSQPWLHDTRGHFSHRFAWCVSFRFFVNTFSSVYTRNVCELLCLTRLCFWHDLYLESLGAN